MSSQTPSTSIETMTPHTVLRLRKDIYSHDLLTKKDMELLLRFARDTGCQPCPEWDALFSEALTDYMVHQNEPEDYIPEFKADWLIAALNANGGICSRLEFDMLIDVMTHALGVPESLSAFALNEIKTAILTGHRNAITGEDCPPGMVTAADVEALRAVLYAETMGTPDHITREEAEVLFDIAHGASKTDPSFDDLFARAIGNHVLAISPHPVEIAAALHFEKWLGSRESLGSFLARSVNAGAWSQEGEDLLDRVLKPFRSALKALGLRGRTPAPSTLAPTESEEIDDTEAAWLIAHLTREGELSAAEKHLLQFLGTEAPLIAPSLQPWIEKATAGEPELSEPSESTAR
ncbi:MAG: hypothetical protein FWD68_16155 [Alphaproteobacteria bacterium]|nr:hypothetical protein [Alphaproteobacteria bacterium]